MHRMTSVLIDPQSSTVGGHFHTCAHIWSSNRPMGGGQEELLALFMDEETQRFNDLPKGNHLLRSWEGLTSQYPLTSLAVFSSHGLCCFLWIFISRDSDHSLNYLNALCAWVRFLCWFSVVCMEEGRDSLRKFRDLFLFSSPDLTLPVLFIWPYLVFSQNQLKSQIPVGVGGASDGLRQSFLVPV